jgi:hypothetical protein
MRTIPMLSLPRQCAASRPLRSEANLSKVSALNRSLALMGRAMTPGLSEAPAAPFLQPLLQVLLLIVGKLGGDVHELLLRVFFAFA